MTLAALALPGSAQAADGALPTPCVDLVVATVNCDAGAEPAPEAQACPGRDLVPNAANLARVKAATTCLVNLERTQRGLRKLKPTTSLQLAARAYAKRMVKERFFEHTAPDGSTFIHRIKKTSYLAGGVRRWSVGENIAWGTGTLATPEQIVVAWMKSPGHRRNILTAGYSELGMGIALGAPVGGSGRNGATYVNEFGERHR